MSTDATETRMETVAGIAAALTSGGVILFALAPLALPILILTLVATLPLLVVGLAVGLVLAILAAPVILVRRLRRRDGASPPSGARRSARAHASHAPGSWPVRADRPGC